MTEQSKNTVLLPKTAETAAAWVAQRYLSDAEFRSAFDKDPKAAVAEIFGGPIPSDVEIKVHHNDEKCWHVSLPSEGQITALADGETEALSGGIFGSLINRFQNLGGHKPHTEHGRDPRLDG